MFSSYIREYVRYLKEHKELSPSTVENYAYELRRLQDFFAGRNIRLSPGEVASHHIGRYMEWLVEERGYQPASSKRVFSVLRSFFNYLVWAGVLGVRENPTLTLPAVRVQKKLPQVLSAAEIRRFLTGIKKVSSFPARDYAVFLLFLETGCRLQELQQLKLGSIHLEEGILDIEGAGGARRAPLTPEACRALGDYMEVRQHQEGTDFLFLSPLGKPMQRSGINSLFKTLARKTGVYRQGLSVHKLRHTCLALKLQEGLNTEELKEFAGYASPNSAQVYRLVVESQKVRQPAMSVGESK